MLSQTWQQGLQNQQLYMLNFENFLETLEKRTSVATFFNNVEPTQTQLQSAWQSETGFEDFVPTFGKVQWFNPDRSVIENIYLPIHDLGTDISSGSLFGLTDKQTDIDVEVIEYFQVTDTSTPVNTKTFTIPQTYAHLLVILCVKSLVAGASEQLSGRINADAGANYGYGTGFTTSPTASVSGSAAAAQSSIFMGFSPGQSADRNSYLVNITEIPQYTVTKTTNFFLSHMVYNNTALAGNTETHLWMGAQYTPSAVVNSLTFFETSNFAPGTWMLILGIK